LGGRKGQVLRVKIRKSGRRTPVEEKFADKERSRRGNRKDMDRKEDYRI